jgi:hypothetical protein
MGKKRNASGILVGKPEGLLGRSRRMWAINVKTDLRWKGGYGVDWIDRAQNKDQRGALVNMVMNHGVA